MQTTIFSGYDGRDFNLCTYLFENESETTMAAAKLLADEY